MCQRTKGGRCGWRGRAADCSITAYEVSSIHFIFARFLRPPAIQKRAPGFAAARPVVDRCRRGDADGRHGSAGFGGSRLLQPPQATLPTLTAVQARSATAAGARPRLRGLPMGWQPRASWRARSARPGPVDLSRRADPALVAGRVAGPSPRQRRPRTGRRHALRGRGRRGVVGAVRGAALRASGDQGMCRRPLALTAPPRR